jgi:hypothetical protein
MSITTLPALYSRVLFFSSALFSLLVLSCTKQNTASIPLDDVPATSAVLKYSGTFQPTAGITITGSAKVYLANGQYQLALDSFRVSNGPDLKVYLSKEYPPANFINLGALQSTAGQQLYIIPGQPDFTIYKYALIHCRQFNHLFGIAELNP